MSDVQTQTRAKVKIKTPSMWKVTLYNDDFTPMEFVTQVLIQLFHKPREEAEVIMLAVHEKGRAQVGVYTKEVAVHKALQVKTVAESYGHPLLAIAEEA